MLLPIVVKRYNPLLFNNETLIAAKGNKVYRFSQSFTKPEEVAKFDEGFFKNVLSHNSLYLRILRRGIQSLAMNENGDFIGAINKNIIYKSRDENVFYPVFNGFRGSRPLSLTYGDGRFVFGEYFNNKNREEVHIFSSYNGKNWDKAYTFPKGHIRHVHSIKYDYYKKGYWVLTGDNDNECGIWFTADQFKSLNPVLKGGQYARAVNIIALQNHLIIPMDSPLEQNYIQLYNIENNILEHVAKIPGSAFHAIESDGIMLVSTVTEPSEINKVNSAMLWGSLDGKKWKCICELKKDIYPVSLQHIFRYAEIVLTPGKNLTSYITAFGRSLKRKDNSMLIWKKNELRDFLKN